MVSKSRTSKRLVSAFGVALIASLALGAFAAGSASALSLSGKYPVPLTGAGGEMKIQWASGTGTCKSTKANGKLLNGTTGEIGLTFEGCKYGPFPCASPGQLSGTITTSTLALKLVYLDAAKKTQGFLLTPPESGAFANATCLAPIVWTGGLMGQMTSPKMGETSKNLALLFEPGSVTWEQKYQQIEGAGTKHQLSQSFSGGQPLSTSLFFLNTLSSPENLTLNP